LIYINIFADRRDDALRSAVISPGPDGLDRIVLATGASLARAMDVP